MHQQQTHSLFVSYRVRSDQEFTQKLALHLDCANLRTYLDRHCLVPGADWQSGFLNGIRSAKVIVIVVSQGALQQMRTAHARPDNFLLEIEVALELKRRDMAKLFVIHLGTYATFGCCPPQEALRHFADFDVRGYAAQRHVHPLSSPDRTVRSILKELFQQQGVSCDPRNIPAVVAQIRETHFPNHRVAAG